MTNDQNHWATYPDAGVAMWKATFPSLCNRVEALIAFGARIVDAGKRLAVWNSDRYSPSNNSTDSFASYAQVAVREHGTLPLVFRRLDGPEPSGVISIYREGSIVDVETSDVGELLRKLRPGRERRAMESAPPVVVSGGSYKLERDQQIVVRVRLDTDIWFPEVIGLREDSDEDEVPDTYDNHELALRHTPRLNAFLAEARDAALTAGGEWALADLGGLAHRYRDMCDASGVLIR